MELCVVVVVAVVVLVVVLATLAIVQIGEHRLSFVELIDVEEKKRGQYE